MISLLYLDGRKNIETPIFSETNKLISQFAKLAIPDLKMQRVFCKIVSAPLTDTESIQFRQQILQDVIQNPVFFAELCKYFERITGFREEFEEARKKFSSLSHQSNNEIHSLRSIHILQTNAFFLKRLLLIIQQVAQLCITSGCKSQGMEILSAQLNSIANSIAFERLLKKVNLLVSYFPTENITTFSVKLDSYGKIIENQIIQIEQSLLNSKDSVWHRFWGKRNSDSEKNNMLLSIPVVKSYDDEILLNASITDINRVLETVIDHITSELVGVHKDLMFYSCAYRVFDSFLSARVTVCFPDFKKSTTIVELIDPILALELSGNGIVSNNFSLCDKHIGILITGENGSGKTVYLRSVLLSYLLAQSGLVIPAKEASLKIKNCFGLFMATSENYQKNDRTVGRFEEETKRISEDIDQLVPNSLYFANEPFQTTTDLVGSQSMADILLYLASQDIEWIIVSHLSLLTTCLHNAPIRHVVCDLNHTVNEINDVIKKDE